MSDAVAFDTHRFVKHLTESGFTEKQAEALADEQIYLLDSNLATKADIAAVRADLELVRADLEGKIESVRADLEGKIEVVRADLEVVRAGLETRIEELRADILASQNNMLKWNLTAMIALSGLIIAVVKLV